MFSFLSDLLRWFGQRLLLTRPSSATAGLPVPDRWRVTWRPPVGRTTGSGDPRPNQLVQGRSLYPKGLVRRWLHRKPLRPFGYRLLEVRETGMVQTQVTAQGWLGSTPEGDAPRSEAGAQGARWLSPARPQPPRSCHPRRSGS